HLRRLHSRERSGRRRPGPGRMGSTGPGGTEPIRARRDRLPAVGVDGPRTRVLGGADESAGEVGDLRPAARSALGPHRADPLGHRRRGQRHGRSAAGRTEGIGHGRPVRRGRAALMCCPGPALSPSRPSDGTGAGTGPGSNVLDWPDSNGRGDMARKSAEIRREEILAATSEEIEATGLRTLRVADVADRLSLSASRVIYHFATKDALGAAAFDHAGRSDREHARELAAGPVSARHRLREVIGWYMPAGSTRSWKIWIDGWSAGLFDADLKATFSALDQEWKTVLADL